MVVKIGALELTHDRNDGGEGRSHKDGRDTVTKTNHDPHRSSKPDPGRGRETHDIHAAISDNGTGAEEADSTYDLGDDSSCLGAKIIIERGHGNKEHGADADKNLGFEGGRGAVELSFKPDYHSADDGEKHFVGDE